MIPRMKLAATRTPDGGEMVLYQHDRDFTIVVNGQDLMLRERRVVTFKCSGKLRHKINGMEYSE